MRLQFHEQRTRLSAPEGCPSPRSPLPSALCFGGGGGASQSTSDTVSTDKKITSESGSILAIQDSPVNVSGGGTITVLSNDPSAALAAVAATRDLASNFAETAVSLTASSNQLAAKVADTPVAISELAAGQKQLFTILGIGLSAVGLWAALRKK